jgi:ABC-type branched-subunit amino acid transport system ATPase component
LTVGGEPVLRIAGLSAGYDAAAVVRDLDLHVDAGEVVALLGPNGAGKTTTLRAISGIVKPMAGSISVDGLDLVQLAPAARAKLGIAHVPEGRGVFFGLTVAEHFRLGHMSEQLDAAAAYRYFPALAELKDRRVGLLSGGEQQMLALGRALARRPRLMLLDEMSLGLAPIIVERLLPVVADYARESGCAVLVVEQHIHVALGVADRGYVLAHGQLVMHATADVLAADHDLILSSYLGGAEISAHATAPTTTSTTTSTTSSTTPTTD